jgi:hypothetical protein
VSLPNLLHRAGATLASHLVLFPSDLSEMFRMLNAALQTYDLKQAGAPLRVFSFLPNRSASIAVRQNGLVLPRDSRLRLQLLSMAEDAASDLVFEHFGKNAGGSEGFSSSQFMVLGSGAVAEAVASKLARLGGGFEHSKTSVDWILPYETLNRAKSDYARFEESGALRLHGTRNLELLPPTLRFLPATALILVVCDASHNFETLLAASESFGLNRLYRVYVSFGSQEIEALARLEHARWLIDRQLAGWTFGQIRDNELKRHPFIIPYDELPEEEKEKDTRAARNIPSILRRAGLQVRRL